MSKMPDAGSHLATYAALLLVVAYRHRYERSLGSPRALECTILISVISRGCPVDLLLDRWRRRCARDVRAGVLEATDFGKGNKKMKRRACAGCAIAGTRAATRRSSRPARRAARACLERPRSRSARLCTRTDAHRSTGARYRPRCARAGRTRRRPISGDGVGTRRTTRARPGGTSTWWTNRAPSPR